MLNNLAVSQRLSRGLIFFQSALKQRFRFPDQTVAEHFIDAPVNALDQFPAGPRDANHTKLRCRSRFLPLRPLFGKWPSGLPNHFNRANHSARILTVNSLERHRIACFQFPKQFLKRRDFQFRPKLRVRRRRFPQPFQIRAKI